MVRAVLLALALAACGRLGFDSATDDAGSSSVDDSLIEDGSTPDAAVVAGAWTTFSSSPGATDLYTMWGFGQTDVWIGGAGGFIKSFDGTSWITKSGVTVGANMFWALHWHGVSWSRVATPVTTTLRAVGRVNGNGLRIVGHGGVVLTHP